ncbi:NAD-dependent epimerase/dehydratase family protein [Acholeplasma vituli]|uniref:NAD-dependent epimerase/dehydratase family protein n=1 Tax=Paracholeplasma vituli TaxID=69473 RepID=A0ABT2PTA2_9MOLU|nr:NAD-dependent epimerase/dehydratase family protein [Paracholeplasma vituli]MCU0104172.1 NAD-dependent epimerase/dehydratase family protein [Paracholeplasma vituli]
MKRVLITGANSYVGTNVEKWLMKEPENFYVENLDMRDPNWKNFDFSKFDVVFHVAGIAHVSTKKSMKDLYFKVNRDLTIETAIKAKESGVKQFIFMSSMIVYNSKETRITKDTKPNPDNFYGLSKLQAEEGILPLQSETFNVVVLRPPMIYGPGSKGNFPKLIKLAKKTPIFPNISNKRSMLYIDNLSESIKTIIKKSHSGTFYPQNQEYSCTTEIVRLLSITFNRRIFFTRVTNLLIRALRSHVSTINKLFSDSYYDHELSRDILKCSTITLNDSISLLNNHE